MGRRTTESAFEPNYPEVERLNLLKVRNQYSMLITCFLLLLANDQGAIGELLQKRDEWKDAL